MKIFLMSLFFLLLLSSFVIWQFNSVKNYNVFVRDKILERGVGRPILKIKTDKGVFLIDNYITNFNKIKINHCYNIKTWGTDHVFNNIHIDKIKDIDCNLLEVIPDSNNLKKN